MIPVRCRLLDPENREQVAGLIRQVDAKFRAAALAWERGNNSGVSALLTAAEERCDRLRDQAEAMLAPLGIQCSYPGLYPCFEVNGYHEHSTRSAILTALGKPMDFVPIA